MNAAAVHGLDVEKIIGGDPAEIAKAQGLGIPVPGAAPGPAASTPPVVQSALATGAAGQTPPAPSGTSANQPQPPAPETAPVQPNGKTPFFDNFGSNLAQAQVPVTNAPNPPTDSTGAPTVPASISPTGTATSPLAQAFSSAQDTERKIGAMPTEAQTLSQDESDKAKLMSPQSATNPTGIPNPYSPAYRPTKWQRVGRGVLGGLEGLAEHGIAGAALGVVDPAAVGAKAYGAPNRAYSTAEAVNQQGLARVNSQEETAEKTYTADTARLKDLLASQADLTKAAAAGETADIKNQMAKVAQELVEVRGRLADSAQSRADATQTRADAAMVAANASKEKADKAGGGGRAGAPSATPTTNQPKPLTQAQEIGLQKTKNKAVDAAQAALTSRGATPNKWAVQRAQQAFQTAQNEYEQAHGITEDSPAHVTVGDDLVWTRGGVPLSQAEQKAPAQPAPAATTQHPKRPAPPTPTVPAPPGAADMQLSAADGQYHYRDAGKHDLGVVK
jgi:hypothetical protein